MHTINQRVTRRHPQVTSGRQYSRYANRILGFFAFHRIALADHVQRAMPDIANGYANAKDRLPEADVLAALRRHAAGDWGDVDEHDRQENELSLKEGFRLLSVYHATDGTKFWIITEADRSATTILLSEDY